MPITKFFIQKRIFTFVIIILLMFAGVLSYRSLHVESNPDVTTPVIYVAIPLPGAAPEEIESLVTGPLEEKLGELEGVEKMESSCWENVSITVVFFSDGVDPKKGFEKFREKVAEARPLMPTEIMEPFIEEVSFENLPMMFLGFGGKGKKPYQLSVEAAKLKKELEKLRGVKSVIMSGATSKQVDIELDPEKLKLYGADMLRTLTEKLGQINTNIPGGKIMIGTEEQLVRTVGRFSTLDDLRNLTIGTPGGKTVSLKEMGTVRVDYPDPATRVRVQGEPGVTLGVMKKRGFGTLEVSERVKELLKKHKDVVILNDQSASITREMGALRTHALFGTILVVVILFVFLGFRVAAIVSTALPLSIFMTFIAMAFMGLSIDMVSLFALVLALGMMVDNAIVVCENIYRHMGAGKDPEKAAIEATDEVGWPILSSTLCTLAAFLPMLIVSGPIGQFTRPIPYVVTFALVSSYIVALCFNPLLSAFFIRKVEHKRSSGSWAVRLRKAYDSILNWSLNHRPAVMLMATALFVVSLLLIPHVGVELFPQLDTSKLYIDVTTPAGTSIENTQKIVTDMETALVKSGQVARYISSSGSTGMRVEIDDRVFIGSNRARLILDLKETEITKQPLKATIQRLRDIVGRVVPEGVESHFMTKILGPPTGPPIDIRISGDNMDSLYTAKDKVVGRLKKMKLPDIKDDFPPDVPQILIQVNQPAAGAIGLTTRDIGGFVFLTLTGHHIGDIVLDNEKQPVILKIRKSATGDASSFENAVFTLPGGKTVRFGDIAVIRPNYGYASIEHQEGKRTVTVTANLGKDQLSTKIIEQLKKDMPTLKLPKDVNVTFAGETMMIGSAFADLKKALLLSMLVIYIILLLEFKSTLQPLIILTCVPYALVGVVFGLLMSGNSFGILSFIGIVCLTGIVVNNAIILIDYANLLRRNGRPLRTAIIESAQTRLRPIIMTKSTIILGILPLAITASSKTQFWKPLCWSLIWGLVVATTLTLVIIPVVYSVAEDWRDAYYKTHDNLKKL